MHRATRQPTRSGCSIGTAVGVVVVMATVVLRWPLGSVRVAAAGPSEPEVGLSWPEIVAVVDDDPRIAASRHLAAAATAMVDAVGAVPNPSLAASTALAEGTDGGDEGVEWELALSVPLEWIAQRGVRMDAAAAEAQAAQAAARALRRDVLLQLRTLFWALVYEQERVAALGELDAQTEELARSVAQRVHRGDARPVQATLVQVEVEKLRGELDAARTSLSARQQQLGLWLRLPASQRLVARGDLAALPRPMTAEQARQIARERHPSVDAARATVRALGASLSVERRARVPAMAVEAFTAHELDRRAYGVGLSLDLPAWSWNTASIRRAESALAAGNRQLEARGLELEAAAIDAHAACSAGVALATRYRDRIIPQARRAATAIERTYQLGEATLLELIDARRTLLTTRRELLSALLRAQTGCSRLSAVVAEELP